MLSKPSNYVLEMCVMCLCFENVIIFEQTFY